MLYLPPEVNRERLLAPVSVPESTWRDPAWRRWVTHRSPLYFALVYGDRFLDPYGTGDQSVSRLHLDMARAAASWRERTEGLREWWVAPRHSAKTTWLYQLAPLWAMCHHHAGHVLALGSNSARASEHLDEIRTALDMSPWIVADFPHVAPGRKDSADLLVTRGGTAFRAQGWSASVLGVKQQGQRPDLIIIDDFEPGAEEWTPSSRRKRLVALENTILPTNVSAVVQVNQSVPAHGSLSHDVVRAVHDIGPVADWIKAGGWHCRHYAAIQVDAEGVERSLWDRQGRNPGGWPLEWLQRERELSPDSYARNYDGRALPPETARSWTRELFAPAPEHWTPIQRVLAVDGAVSTGPSSDYTGFAVAAQVGGAAPLHTVVEYARSFRFSPEQRRGKVIELLAMSDDVGMVIVEQNQGADLWLALLRDLGSDFRWPAGRTPPPVRLVPAGKGSKLSRQAQHLYRWQQGRTRQAHRLPEFMDQAERYPHVEHDDVLDAVDLADRWLIDHPA